MAPANGRRRLTLDAIFETHSLDDKVLKQPRWLADNHRLAYLDSFPGTDHDTVFVLNTETASAAPVLDPATLICEGQEEPLPVVGYQWSPADDTILLTGAAPARFTPCGDLYTVAPGQALMRLTRSESPQYHPGFSPDGKYLALVRGNNLWTIDLASREEHQLTFNGSDTVYNGRCGWVYEEELGLAQAWQWSPDSHRIAFLQQDETGVPEVLISRYDQPHTEPEHTRYPKAGDPIPTVKLGVLEIESGEITWLPIADAALTDQGFYVAMFQWAPNGASVLVQRIPRLQNRLDLVVAPIDGSEPCIAATHTDSAWVDPAGTLRFLSDSQLVWPSDEDGHQHLYLRNLDGKCIRQLTSGKWDVEQVVGIDRGTGTVFFTAAWPAPYSRALLAVGADGGEPKQVVEGEGRHSALFAEDGSRFVHTHSTLDTPPTVVVRRSDGTPIHALIDDPTPGLKPYERSAWEVLKFETTRGDTLYARMLTPPDFKPDRRYPVLMCTYGGPGSQVVLDAWGGKGGLWNQLLAQMGYVIFMVDNRGTGGRGRDFRKQTYLRLGQMEVEDQIEGARFLSARPFVDAGRIGIWGWSYGGFMAASCMLRGADVFRAGIAVAPVTDWHLYDAVYTERFMRTPADNPDGYCDTTPLRFAENLQGRLLIVQGTSDDNVHFQNSARLASALQDANKQFTTMFYPGKRHGIENRHLHLYTLMTDFLRKNL